MSDSLFDDKSRVGFELELLAPAGKTRIDLAHHLAEKWGATVRYGLKFLGTFPQRGSDESISKLNLALRVEKDGERLVDIVDDCTIVSELDDKAKPVPKSFLLVMNDVRFAAWVEQVAWVDELNLDAMLRPLTRTFFGDMGELGEGGLRLDQRPVFDRYGQILAIVNPPERDRDRVAEVVTKPLTLDERDAFLGDILDAVRELGFFVPKEAALHAHYDAGPWQDTLRLARLIDAFAGERHRLRYDVKTNPECKRLGNFSDAVTEAAVEELDRIAKGREASAFSEFASRIRRAGTTKFIDLNIQGVVNKRPKQRTLEVRFLPMAVELGAFNDTLGVVERFLESAYSGSYRTGGSS